MRNKITLAMAVVGMMSTVTAFAAPICPDMQRTAFISPAEARKLCGIEASAEYEKTRGPLRI